MTDLAIRIAYQGAGFHGSQIQPGLRTVEGELLSALEKIIGTDREQIDLRLAGRTDRGVNSVGNVASMETGGMNPPELLKALNSVCKGVAGTAYAVVDDSFLPRHADMRTYEYVTETNADAANECLSLFEGIHDFSGFCRSEGKDAVINLVKAEARREGGATVMEFQADHFLWNMVRRMASATIRCAEGRICLEDVRSGLEGGESNFGLAPAEGLTLTDIRYGGLSFIPSPDPALAKLKSDGLLRTYRDRRFFEML